MAEDLFLAVDLGAGSGRVVLGGLAPGELRLEEIRRFHYPPEVRGDHLRWDFSRLLGELQAGLREGLERGRTLGRPIRSVGVDSWGVDYGLIGGDGRLLEDPICYRDRRTQRAMDEVLAQIPREQLFGRTGVQLMEFNTIFQLHAHVREGLPAAAHRLLLIPDLVHHHLTGRVVTEATIGSTTQMMSTAGGWDRGLLETLGLPRHLLCDLVPPGTPLGPIGPDWGLGGVAVVAPASHDTASAVAGTPLDRHWAYISSGTWSLVGVERDQPLVTPAVARGNFTNERGACGTVRFLKNVMGLWLLEACRREWQERGEQVDHDRLLADAAARPDVPALIFPDDRRLLNPPCMLEALATQLAETGQALPGDPGGVTKMILDSLAFRYATVLRRIEALTGTAVPGVHVVGGGAQNRYLNQATADATGKPLRAGPIEATALGNILVQAISAGRFAGLEEARAHLRAHSAPSDFQPRPRPAWTATAARYAEIEGRLESLS